MAAFRDFDAEVAEQILDAGPPIVARVSGVKFSFPQPIALGGFPIVMHDVYAVETDEERAMLSTALMTGLLLRWVASDQRDALRDALEAFPTPTIVEQLVSWLIEQATSRPSTPPSSSANGSPPAGPSSTADEPFMAAAL